MELAVSLAVLTLGFALLFKYVPDAEIRWGDVWLGEVVTAVLFTPGKTAIGYYLGQASIGSAYGAAGRFGRAGPPGPRRAHPTR